MTPADAGNTLASTSGGKADMSIVMAVLRATIGALFIGHGAQKLFGSFGGHGPTGTGQFFEQELEIKPGKPMALAAGGSELTGGVLLALGLATPVAAGLLASVMSGAIASVHSDKGPWVTEGGWEYNAVLIASLLVIAGAGPGDLSLDRALGIERSGTGVAFLSVGAGAAAGVANVLLSKRIGRDEYAATA